MFRLVSEPIEGQLATAMEHVGAIAEFRGVVRDIAESREVRLLEYEAYHELAEKEGGKIVAEAREKFDIVDAACFHRVGKLEVGETAIHVVVTAQHRAAAFDACEYIVEQVKARVPIWKKEHFADSEPKWVNAEKPSLSQEAFYARQTTLPEVGAAGQSKLAKAKVLVVGLGGLGSAAATYLAAAGVGTIGLCDFDRVEISNLHRQVLFDTTSLGQEKTKKAAKRLALLNPFVEFVQHPILMEDRSAADLVGAYDLVLECTDSFDSKFAANDACVRAKVPLVVASLHQYEGQLIAYMPGAKGGCLRCLWPDQPEPGCVGTCAEVGVLGAIAGVFGSLQAAEALKMILDIDRETASEHLIAFDLLSYQLHKVKRSRNPQCSACQGKPIESSNVELRLSEIDLSAFDVIDIREVDELPRLRVEHRVSPLSRGIPELAADGRATLLVCASGARSLKIAKELRADGMTNVFSLKAGERALRGLVVATPA